MKTTRQLLCEHLQFKRSASANELAKALHVTPANIRHHISAMLAEGIIEIIGKRPSVGRGRPVQLFGLVEQLSRHNLANLSDVLLSELEDNRSKEEHQAVLKRLALRMLDQHLNLPHNIAQRYFQAIQLLNVHHYEARWEAHASAPRIIFSHCPYFAIIHTHPELCQIDRFLLEGLLGTNVSQITKLGITSHGVRQCIFLAGIANS